MPKPDKGGVKRSGIKTEQAGGKARKAAAKVPKSGITGHDSKPAAGSVLTKGPKKMGSKPKKK